MYLQPQATHETPARRCREAIGQTLAAAPLRHRLTFKHLYHDRIEITGYNTRLS
ncbi:MAG: hypothetical protein ACREXW_05665 [Gammaproteobacteria bacterium]